MRSTSPTKTDLSEDRSPPEVTLSPPEVTLSLPQSYEVVLARKISAQRNSLLQTFAKLDADGDGYLSMKDLKIGLNSLFDIDLTQEQIAGIFQRACLFSSAHKYINDVSILGGTCMMTLPIFLRYIENTAESTKISSSSISSSGSIFKANVKSKEKTSPSQKSISYRTRQLRSLVFGLIKQSVPASTNMAATATFLDMDSSRKNRIPTDNIRVWLQKKGFYFNDDDMKVLLGKWKTNESLSVKEFGLFVDSLAAEVDVNGCAEINVRDDTIIQLVVSRLQNEETSQENDDDKSDEELIWAFLNHFRDMNKTYVQGFHVLDKNDDKYLSATDIRNGLKGCGFDISLERSRCLISKFAKRGSRDLDKTGFIRFITSVPKREKRRVSE